MATLANSVLDNGLSSLTASGTRIDICTSEPTTYALATTSRSLGNSTITITAPSDRVGGGREITINSVTDASVTGSGIAGFYAITNGSNTLYATGSLSTAQSVTAGNTFSLGSFTIGIPDPA